MCHTWIRKFPLCGCIFNSSYIDCRLNYSFNWDSDPSAWDLEALILAWETPCPRREVIQTEYMEAMCDECRRDAGRVMRWMELVGEEDEWEGIGLGSGSCDMDGDGDWMEDEGDELGIDFEDISGRTARVEWIRDARRVCYPPVVRPEYRCRRRREEYDLWSD